MLELRQSIVSEFPRGYVIGATDPVYGEVQIHIGSQILIEFLGSPTAIQNNIVEQLFADMRPLFLAASQKAFDERRDKHVELQPRDFR
jgi:hypothetical protein